MSKFIAAYDFGTSGVKVALVDSGGRIIASREKPYALLRPAPTRVEQDPDEYWDAVCRATKDVMQDAELAPDQIIALSFSTQEQNIIPIDRDGKILYNAISWLDSRAKKQADEINEKLGVDALRSQDLYCRLLWLKQNEAEIYEKTEYFHTCNSYLQYKATGVKAAAADSPILYELPPDFREMLDAVFAVSGLDESRIPPMLNACDKSAELDAKGAEELGLVKGIPVFGGSVDVTGAAAGAGCVKEGDAHMYFGSSGWLSAVINESVQTTGDGLYRVPGILPGTLIYGGCINSCCLTLDWAIDRFYGAEKNQLADDKTFPEGHKYYGSGIYDVVNDDAKAVSPGSDGLMVGPWLNGEQCPINDPRARGVFFNVKEEHKRGHFINAIYESICYSMKWQLEYYENDAGGKISRIGANGGGSLSDHWMQILADVLQMPVYVPSHARHSGAIGAALAASIGLGLTKEDEISSFVSVEKEFFPRREYADLYEDKYGKFKKLYLASKELFTELNDDPA